jgi:hypothetical protein
MLWATVPATCETGTRSVSGTTLPTPRQLPAARAGATMAREVESVMLGRCPIAHFSLAKK